MPELNFSLFSTLFFLVDLTIRVGLSFRVIMRKRSHGVTLAWLVVILLFPFIGVILYLLFGENRISERRTKRMHHSFKYYQHWLQSLQDRAPVQWQHLGAECLPRVLIVARARFERHDLGPVADQPAAASLRWSRSSARWSMPA